MRILAVSGSLRAASSNTTVLRALASAAPADVHVTLNPPLDWLPFFNPDIEQAGPEYAHGVPGVLKNALDWLVGGVEIVGKPIAVLNPRSRSTYAQPSLVETLRVTSLTWQEIAADAGMARLLRSAIAAIIAAPRAGVDETPAA